MRSPFFFIVGNIKEKIVFCNIYEQNNKRVSACTAKYQLNWKAQHFSDPDWLACCYCSYSCHSRRKLWEVECQSKRETASERENASERAKNCLSTNFYLLTNWREKVRHPEWFNWIKSAYMAIKQMNDSKDEYECWIGPGLGYRHRRMLPIYVFFFSNVG